MKIAIVCNNLSFITGGPRLIFGLAKNLEAMGHTVVMYAPDFDPAYFAELARGLTVRVVHPHTLQGVGVRPTGFFGWIRWKVAQERYDIALAKAIAEAMDLDFDVVNIHDFAYRTGYFYKRRNPRAKVVWHENAPPFAYVKREKILYDVLGFLYGIFKTYNAKKYFRAVDAVAVLDHFNRQWSEAHWFKNITVVRPGIDFEKFYAPVKDFRERASRKQVQLLAVGALNVYRRYDNVVEAVRLLREWGYDARALIVANNIWHEDQCRDDLVALVKKYNLKPYVDFRFEGMPEADLIKTFQTSDVFVQAVYSPPPSHHGWGLVNFEALAAGIPLVVVRSSTATEVLEEGKTALFFEPLNSREIAEKVKFLVDNPNEYRRLAEAGQRYVKENQSWRKYAEEMADLFAERIA